MAWPNDYVAGSLRKTLLDYYYPSGINSYIVGVDVDFDVWASDENYGGTVLLVPPGTYDIDLQNSISVIGNRYIMGLNPADKPILNISISGDTHNERSGIILGDTNSGGGLMDLILNINLAYDNVSNNSVSAVSCGQGVWPMVGVIFNDFTFNSATVASIVSGGIHLAEQYLIACVIGTGTISGDASSVFALFAWVSPVHFINGVINNPLFEIATALLWGSESNWDTANFDFRNSIIEINPAGTLAMDYSVNDLGNPNDDTYIIYTKSQMANQNFTFNEGTLFDTDGYTPLVADKNGVDMSSDETIPYTSDINDALFTVPWDRGCVLVGAEAEENNNPNISNYSPTTGSCYVSRNPVNATISITAYDQDADSLTVNFYNADTSALIGTDTVVSSGTATTQWANLPLGATYSWFPTVFDGTTTITGTTNSFDTEAAILNHLNFNSLNPASAWDDDFKGGDFGAYRAYIERTLASDQDTFKREGAWAEKIENPISKAEKDTVVPSKTTRNNNFSDAIISNPSGEDLNSDGIVNPEAFRSVIHKKPNRWGF